METDTTSSTSSSSATMNGDITGGRATPSSTSSSTTTKVEIIDQNNKSQEIQHNNSNNNNNNNTNNSANPTNKTTSVVTTTSVSSDNNNNNNNSNNNINNIDKIAEWEDEMKRIKEELSILRSSKHQLDQVQSLLESIQGWHPGMQEEEDDGEDVDEEDEEDEDGEDDVEGEEEDEIDYIEGSDGYYQDDMGDEEDEEYYYGGPADQYDDPEIAYYNTNESQSRTIGEDDELGIDWLPKTKKNQKKKIINQKNTNTNSTAGNSHKRKKAMYPNSIAEDTDSDDESSFITWKQNFPKAPTTTTIPAHGSVVTPSQKHRVEIQQLHGSPSVEDINISVNNQQQQQQQQNNHVYNKSINQTPSTPYTANTYHQTPATTIKSNPQQPHHDAGYHQHHHQTTTSLTDTKLILHEGKKLINEVYSFIEEHSLFDMAYLLIMLRHVKMLNTPQQWMALNDAVQNTIQAIAPHSQDFVNSPLKYRNKQTQQLQSQTQHQQHLFNQQPQQQPQLYHQQHIQQQHPYYQQPQQQMYDTTPQRQPQPLYYNEASMPYEPSLGYAFETFPTEVYGYYQPPAQPPRYQPRVTSTPPYGISHFNQPQQGAGVQTAYRHPLNHQLQQRPPQNPLGFNSPSSSNFTQPATMLFNTYNSPLAAPAPPTAQHPAPPQTPHQEPQHIEIKTPKNSVHETPSRSRHQYTQVKKGKPYVPHNEESSSSYHNESSSKHSSVSADSDSDLARIQKKNQQLIYIKKYQQHQQLLRQQQQQSKLQQQQQQQPTTKQQQRSRLQSSGNDPIDLSSIHSDSHYDDTYDDESSVDFQNDEIDESEFELNDELRKLGINNNSNNNNNNSSRRKIPITSDDYENDNGNNNNNNLTDTNNVNVKQDENDEKQGDDSLQT